MAITFTDWEHWTDGTESGVLDWTLAGLKNVPSMLPYIEAIRQALVERHLLVPSLPSPPSAFTKSSPLVLPVGSNTNLDNQIQRIIIETSKPVSIDGMDLVYTNYMDVLPKWTVPNILADAGLSSYQTMGTIPISDWLFQSKELLSRCVWFPTGAYAYGYAPNNIDYFNGYFKEGSGSSYSSMYSSFSATSWTGPYPYNPGGALQRVMKWNYPYIVYYASRWKATARANVISTGFQKQLDFYVGGLPEPGGYNQYVNRDYNWPENKWSYLATIGPQDVYTNVPIIEVGNFDDISVLESDLVSYGFYHGWYQQETCVCLMIKCDIPGGFIFQ